MIAYALGILGIVMGVMTAKKRGGNRMDMAQYGVGFGIAFFLVSYLILLIINAFL